MKNSKLITTGRTTRQVPRRDASGNCCLGTEEINYEAFLIGTLVPFLDLDAIESMARRAATNKSGRSHDGPLEVRVTSRRRIR